MSIEKTIDVTALGELLIDFTDNGLSDQGNPLLEANPGGAPCNVLAMIAKSGKKAAFIGKVGNDMFGRMLKKRTEAQNIDMSGLELDNEVHTTLAFVEKPKIFHLGTLSMTDEPADSATQLALKIAKEAGCLISFDPNLRPPLWSSEEKAKEKIRYGLERCDILKISDNEIEFMTGETDLDKGIKMIIDEYKIPLVFATFGPDGSKAYFNGIEAFEEGFSNPKTIETTGAGDTFCASALIKVLDNGGIESFTEEYLHELLTFANAGASLVTTRRGALGVMPTLDEVAEYRKSYNR